MAVDEKDRSATNVVEQGDVVPFGNLPDRAKEFYRDRVRVKVPSWERFRWGGHALDWEAAREYEAAPRSWAKWDRRYLALARHVASWSKDPSTQAGAVIVAPDGYVVALGYNGFPRRTDDSPEQYADRDVKLRRTVHCEINAIVSAKRDLAGCTLYTYPFMSCAVCSGVVIQAGITRCVAPPIPEDKRGRWAADMAIAERQFEEAGVELSIIDLSAEELM